jgi:glycosyltransferase involved in cell wall biosynthesis
MAMELPVIATPVGAIAELVVHGETGLLIEAGSSQALAGAISWLAANPEHRQAMGLAGRRRVEKYFDGSRNYRELIALIKSVAAGRSAPRP